MTIQVINNKQGTESTLSTVWVAGLGRGFFLQDTDRGLTSDMTEAQIAHIKIHGRTAIPTGRYELQMTESKRFGKVMPELLNVPGFDGIRIHGGNYVGNTDGCLLPGTWFDQDKAGYYRVWESQKQFASLLIDINAAVKRKEKIYVEISRQYAVKV